MQQDLDQVEHVDRTVGGDVGVVARRHRGLPEAEQQLDQVQHVDHAVAVDVARDGVLGRARRIARVAAGVDLVAVEEPVLVPIDADPQLTAGRHECEGELRARPGQGKQGQLGEHLGRPVRSERIGAGEVVPALLAGDDTLDDHAHRRGLGKADHVREGRRHTGGGRVGQRRLHAHPGVGIGREAHQEGLDVAALLVAGRPAGELEAVELEKLEDRVDAAVVDEAVPAVVVAQRVVEARLLVHISQLRDLDALRLLEQWPGGELAVGSRRKRVTGRAVDPVEERRVEEVLAGDGVAAVGEGPRQGAVELAEGVRRRRERGHERLVLGHLSGRELRVVAEQRLERAVEGREVLAVAAPVEGLGADDADERLGGHRPLHRVPVLAAAEAEVADLVEGIDRARGIAEIPGDLVHLTVDVAARARRLPEPRGPVGVVEKRPAQMDGLRGRVVKGKAGGLGERPGVDDRDRSLELVEHEKTVPRGFEPHPRGSGADLDEADPSQGAVHDRHVVGAHAGDIAGGAVIAPRDPAGIADRLVAHRLAHRGHRVVEMRVEIDQRVGATGAADGGGHRPNEDALDVGLVPDVVDRLRAHHRHLPRRLDRQGHVGVHEPGGVGDPERAGVDQRHVVVVQVPGDRGGPVAAVVVAPHAGAVLADDHAHRGRRRQTRRDRRVEEGAAVGRWVGIEGVGVHRRGDDLLPEDRRPVAGLEDRRVDGGAVGGQSAGILALDQEHGRPGGEVQRIVHLHLVELRDRDEGPLRAAGEDHVGRLVAGVNRGHDVHRGEVDDAHAVGDVVDHPYLGVRSGPHRDRIEPHRNRAGPDQPRGDDREHLEAVVGGVDRQQARPVRRQVERADVRALPVDERLTERPGRPRRHEGERSQEPRCRSHRKYLLAPRQVRETRTILC